MVQGLECSTLVQPAITHKAEQFLRASAVPDHAIVLRCCPCNCMVWKCVRVALEEAPTYCRFGCRVGDDGTKVRVLKKTGEALPNRPDKQDK
jgi:hypothetical protein